MRVLPYLMGLGLLLGAVGLVLGFLAVFSLLHNPEAAAQSATGEPPTLTVKDGVRVAHSIARIALCASIFKSSFW